ncbi:MAG: efflux RND transporter periplasmic adaptor subunit [Pseudomonadales bacterium]
MFLRIAATIVALGLLIAGVAVVKHNQNAARASAMAGGPPPATVTATEVQVTQWAQRIEAVGDITAVQDVAVASEVPGKVMEINFESGAPVRAGDVLVRLDAGDDRAQLEALKAELNLAQLEFQRVQKLRGSAAFSQSLLDRTQSQMASLQAQVERQEVLVQRKVVRAPFDGVLGIRQVSLGDIIAPGDPIVRLQSLAPIYVDFTVPERHRGALQPGQTLEVSVAAWPDEVFHGEVIVISPDVDVRSRTLKLRGQLANEDLRLQPGMFATVHLILSGAEPVLTLPRTAISFFAYGESVFTIQETEGKLTVKRQPIKVGRTRGDQVEVLSGLTAGQRVVHTGHMKLRDGQAIVVDPGIPLPQDVGDR